LPRAERPIAGRRRLPRRPPYRLDDPGHPRPQGLLLSLRLRRRAAGVGIARPPREVDAKRLAVTGISQGGGLSLAVAALSDRAALALPDIPFLCDYRRAIEIAQAGPYPEIPGFLKNFPHLYDDVIRTLSYFDNLNLAPWIRCKTIVSNCLWDDICPPSTIFGVYNHITAEKRIDLYPFHKHEVPYEHTETRFRAIVETLRP
jgi:cephalosporin-C deacetylase